jgi:hypothetical protein
VIDALPLPIQPADRPSPAPAQLKSTTLAIDLRSRPSKSASATPAAGRTPFNFEAAVTLKGGEYFFAPSLPFLPGL